MDPVTCIIKDKIELYRMYMPFIVGGGLFIPMREVCPLGTKVSINLILLEDSFNFISKVIWQTPEGASIRQQAGIGIQLTPNEAELHTKIKKYLADPELIKIEKTLERYTLPF